MEDLYGKNPQAVIDLLNDRKQTATICSHQSRRKLALIVEGGGMRGVLSAGSLLAVDLLGYRSTIDEVYATSAGGVNAAYFLSGQGEMGISVYFDNINNFRFINPLRLSKIVDVSYAYDYIVREVKPLNEKKIRQGHAKFYLSVTDFETGSNVLVDVQKSSEPIYLVLKASSAMPVLYNKTVTLEGRQYIDGGISDIIPIRQAIDRGCTDILVLLSRAPGYIGRQPNVLQRLLFFLCMGRKHPHLTAVYRTAHIRENLGRRMAFGEDIPAGVNVVTICPSSSELIVSRTTIKRDKLINGAYALARKTFEFFSGDISILKEVFNRLKKVYVP